MRESTAAEFSVLVNIAALAIAALCDACGGKPAGCGKTRIGECFLTGHAFTAC
jgi:hypothetical protein